MSARPARSQGLLARSARSQCLSARSARSQCLSARSARGRVGRLFDGPSGGNGGGGSIAPARCVYSALWTDVRAVWVRSGFDVRLCISQFCAPPAVQLLSHPHPHSGVHIRAGTPLTAHCWILAIQCRNHTQTKVKLVSSLKPWSEKRGKMIISGSCYHYTVFVHGVKACETGDKFRMCVVLFIVCSLVTEPRYTSVASTPLRLCGRSRGGAL